MEENYLNSDNSSSIDRHFNDLNSDQIFSFLKRYYNDSYPIVEDELQIKTEGIYFEAIEILEQLYHRLIDISDFIGYAKIDWDNACKAQKKNKIEEILAFYNGLIIDVALMKASVNSYYFTPKVRAFIDFVDSVENCRFRSDVQVTPWTTEDFPHDEIFKIVDQFKQYFKDRKFYHTTFILPEWKEQAKNIEKAISKFKKITQALYVIKFSTVDLSERESAKLISESRIDSYLADLNSERKLSDFIEWFIRQDIVGKLPWICTLTKVEIDIRKQVRFTIGLILDTTDQRQEPKLIENELAYNVTQQLGRMWFEPYINFDIVQLDQIFDQLEVESIRNIKLSNKKEVDLMLKWYLGVFYKVSTIIQPANLGVETSIVERPVHLRFNRKKLENIKYKLDHKTKARMLGNVKTKSNWNPIKLLKQVPTYFSSIHYFYKGLKGIKGVTNSDIDKLQKLNLFIAYLEAAHLDGLQDTLKMTKPQKWADVVQIYLLLLKDWDSSYLELNDLAICELEPLNSSFSRNYYIQEELESEYSLKMIVDALSRLKRGLLRQEKVASLKISTRLVEKNIYSAMEYLKHSFKQNSAVLRFIIDNSNSCIELSELKKIFTQFIKSVGRAPKRIGGEIDAYIGYYIFNNQNYSIDCTVIFALRESVSAQDIREGFKNYWQDFVGKYTDANNVNFSGLILSIIPTFLVKDSNLAPLVINKGDRLIPQLKKDLVRFYTAYEYITGYKIKKDKGEKRPELFLRGRTRKLDKKSEGAKKAQQIDIDMFQENDNSDVENNNQEKEREKIDNIRRDIVQHVLANLKPLVPENYE